MRILIGLTLQITSILILASAFRFYNSFGIFMSVVGVGASILAASYFLLFDLGKKEIKNKGGWR